MAYSSFTSRCSSHSVDVFLWVNQIKFKSTTQLLGCNAKTTSFNIRHIPEKNVEHKYIKRKHTFGSSGGSNCTIQSTWGISKPLAATSVHNRIDSLALQNWKNVWVRFACFCFPCKNFQHLIHCNVNNRILRFLNGFGASF